MQELAVIWKTAIVLIVQLAPKVALAEVLARTEALARAEALAQAETRAKAEALAQAEAQGTAMALALVLAVARAQVRTHVPPDLPKQLMDLPQPEAPLFQRLPHCLLVRNHPPPLR